MSDQVFGGGGHGVNTDGGIDHEGAKRFTDLFLDNPYMKMATILRKIMGNCNDPVKKGIAIFMADTGKIRLIDSSGTIGEINQETDLMKFVDSIYTVIK